MAFVEGGFVIGSQTVAMLDRDHGTDTRVWFNAHLEGNRLGVRLGLSRHTGLGWLRWYGGKSRLMPWIGGFFPRHANYVSVFGGTGNDILWKEPCQGVETFNDISGELVNLLRVIAHPNKDIFWQFKRLCADTPYSRAIYVTLRTKRYAIRRTHNNTVPDQPDIEWAVAAFVVNSWSVSAQSCSTWRRHLKFRSPAVDWQRKVMVQLDIVRDRFLTVQIDQSSWEAALERYDGEDYLAYCDPPYLPETRKRLNAYLFEMGTEDHEKFLAAAQNYQGAMVVSAYPSELYESALSNHGWMRFDKRVPIRAALNLRHGRWRTESVYLNPRAAAAYREKQAASGGEAQQQIFMEGIA